MSMKEMSLRSFLVELASDSPAPGGGSVAAFDGAMGASLVSMVARLTVGKEKYKEHQAIMEELMNDCDKMRDEFLDLMDKDSNAFNDFMKAMRLPKNTEEEKRERTFAMQEALKKAALVPMETLRRCLDLAKKAEIAVERGNVNAVTDAGTALLLASSSAKAASYNVLINLKSIKDEGFANQLKSEVESLLKAIDDTVIRGLKSLEENL